MLLVTDNFLKNVISDLSPQSTGESRSRARSLKEFRKSHVANDHD